MREEENEREEKWKDMFGREEDGLHSFMGAFLHVIIIVTKFFHLSWVGFAPFYILKSSKTKFEIISKHPITSNHTLQSISKNLTEFHFLT